LADNKDERPAGGGPFDIKPVSITDEMKRSYLDYAMSVIVSRALPDVRDGLKPRAPAHSVRDARAQFTPDRPYNKSARAVGETMGKYHRTAIWRSMTRWCAWRRISPCACR